MVWCLPVMQEVLGSNPLRGNMFLTFLEKTKNRGSNIPNSVTHALICEELKIMAFHRRWFRNDCC